MKTFRNESREEGARPALGRRSDSDGSQLGAHHKIEGAGTSAQASLLSDLAFNAHTVAQRSVIQLQRNCGNQCVQRAVKISRKNEAEVMQTKPPGAHINRQVEEEPEEEAIQTKPAVSEIQRQPEDEEENKPV